MSYMHIENLYKDAYMLEMFTHVYGMEKIHGTSAHLSWKSGRLDFFSGGSKHETFVALFDEDTLKQRFTDVVEGETSVHVYGEAYGGKLQAMRGTYGDDLRFVAFEVKIGDLWLSVPKAEAFVHKLGLEFVYYRKIPCTIEALDWEAIDYSVQAQRNGVEGPKMAREGIVIRPLEELRRNNGSRVIAKHKNPEFSERKSKRDTVIRPEKQFRLTKAKEVAEEWVTDMRLTHVLDALGGIEPIRNNLGLIIPAMSEDVQREGAGEFEWTKELSKAVGHATVELIKQRERARVAGR